MRTSLTNGLVYKIGENIFKIQKTWKLNVMPRSIIEFTVQCKEFGWE